MEKLFRIGVLSNNVDFFAELSTSVQQGQYPFMCELIEDFIDIPTEKYDVIVDATDMVGDEAMSAYTSILASGLSIVSSNYRFILSNSVELVNLSKSSGVKLYLNSIFSGVEKFKLLNISEKNISNYLDDIKSDSKLHIATVVKYIYQDLVRAHSRWDPTYEEQRKQRENIKREATKQSLYELAKDLNVELEAQPCGIDPKIPEKRENE